MTKRAAMRLVFLSFVCLLPVNEGVAAQSAEVASAKGQVNAPAELKFVVILSRHGVRPPLTKPGAIDQFSAAPWPKWDVPPGYLTAHGYELMKMFGAWDRARLARQGLFAGEGCNAAVYATIVADSDQRTRETGKALAEGMFPGCPIKVHARAVGTPDPLFRIAGGLHGADSALASAAIEGRIGGDPRALTEAYQSQMAALDRVLAGCGHASASTTRRTSLFDIPDAPGDRAEYFTRYRGRLVVASTLAENLLLEYTNGMSDADTGWGCVDGATLRTLMQVDTAAWNYAFRTPTVARMYASNLLDHIELSMEQSVTGKPVAGALSEPDDRLLIIVGHDTNIVTIAGALGIDWIIDGRVDDTPPGGALLFELWRPADGGRPFVRLEYTAQTLEQMRQLQPLTPANPPASAQIFVPGCSRKDMSCSWDGFSAAVHASIDPAYVNPQP
jgi:4-phytase/acid phosphatase